MTNAISWKSLPTDALFHVLSFLEPAQVTRVERTCLVWKRVIDAEGQPLWKEFCSSQNISIITADDLSQTALGSHSAGSGIFSNGILHCIAQYVNETNYKKQAAFPRANLEFYSQTMYIGNMTLGAFANEPFVSMSLTSRLRRRDPLPAALSKFPMNLPLRLLMDKEGNYKNEGDEVRVIFNERRCILTCKHARHFSDQREITSWKMSLDERVRISMNNRMISLQDVARAKELAKTGPDWMNLDDLKRKKASA
ncbi:MAG: F-box protein [Chlamydiales bacterium]